MATQTYTTTYSCGHTSVGTVDCGDTPYGDKTISCLCRACEKRQDSKVNSLVRKLTGQTPGDGLVLRWRLRSTVEEVQQAFEAAGLPMYLTLVRDAGDNAAQERLRHAVALRTMQCGRKRCACGSVGTWENTISGSIADREAIWAACENCSGSAVGGGLTGETMFAAIAAIEAASRCGESIDAWVDAA